MKMKSVSFFNYVEKTLNPYKWALSFIASVMIAGLFSIIVVKGKIESNKQILAALSPYVASLSESSDRPEILRVLANVSKANSARIVLVKDGYVFGSSGLTSELDVPFENPKINYKIFDVSISGSQIVSSANDLYIFSDLEPTLKSSAGIFLATFFLFFVFAVMSSLQMKRAIRKALKPLDQLHQEIENLPNFESSQSEPIRVQELENIRQTVLSTKVDLENAKDKLAEELAQKLSAKSYKRLIHDLHNPVAALRQMVSMAISDNVNTDDKAEAISYLPQIADQILAQVTAAKKNLESEPVSLREGNIVSTVQDSVKQVSIISSDKKIITEKNCDEALVAHDPDLLKRALVNLLENATSAARSLVRVTVQKDEAGTSIRVCDDGNGMDESLIPLYFQGRGQSGKANRQAFGLSSTNHIVRSHGAKLIYGKSDLGGASFLIRLGAV